MSGNGLLRSLVFLPCLGLFGGSALAQNEPQPAPAEAPADPAAADAVAGDPTAADVPAQEEQTASGLQFEAGLFGGLHIFAKDLELGVEDDPGFVDSPQTYSGIFGLRLGLNYLPWFGIEGELGAVPTKGQFDNLRATLLAYRANALLYLAHGKVRPFFLVGAGLVQVVSTSGEARRQLGLYQKETDGEVHGGVGIKFDVSDVVALRLDGRIYAMPNNRANSYTPTFEFLAGISLKAGGISAPPPAPPAPADSDGDGIMDPDDKCPSQAEDKDGFQDEDGCPEADNDADGIVDGSDQCPLEPESKNGIDDADGCPEKDEDSDGLYGTQDKCPTEAEDKDGFEDEDGCPDLDNDKDGVPDATDKCKDQPETRNGFQDADGCPDEVPAEVKRFTGVIKGINFKKNSADIQKSSFKLLGDAVKVLKSYPDLRIEIAGHTSSEGERQKNLDLSQARADAVKAYLTSAGVEASRVETVGFGPDKPVALNKTKKGREQNRRIEFRLLTAESTTAAPGTPVGAPAAPAATPPATLPPK